jgi:hypothetical protein
MQFDKTFFHLSADRAGINRDSPPERRSALNASSFPQLLLYYEHMPNWHDACVLLLGEEDANIQKAYKCSIKRKAF